MHLKGSTITASFFKLFSIIHFDQHVIAQCLTTWKSYPITEDYKPQKIQNTSFADTESES